MIHNLDALAERIQLGWKQLGYEEGLKARIVNYAEDFVILSVKKGEEAYEAMKTGRGCAVYPRRHSTTLATVLGDVIHQKSLPRSGAHSRYWLRQWLCTKHRPTGSCHPSLSRRVSLRDARAGTIGTDNAQLPVSESMQ
jgi:hypothetical protein